ncbi:MAG: thioredoxin family protein, partial [Phycisphaeraceae bacterium]|nr:thioredoxin family protein [Phycisphaeraceae bacterium]
MDKMIRMLRLAASGRITLTGILVMLVSSLAVSPAHGQGRSEAVRHDATHTSVQLVSQTATLAPGTKAVLGVRFQPDEIWYLYYRNPGEAGMPATIDSWKLPEGFKADDGFLWPSPMQYESFGLVNYVYRGDYVLPVIVHVPADAEPGEVTIGMSVSYQSCDPEVCVPGEVDLELRIKIEASPPKPDSRWASLFTYAWRTMPRAAMPGEAHAFLDEDGRISLFVNGLLAGDEDAKVYFYSTPEGVIEPSAPQVVSRDGHVVRLKLKPDEFRDDPVTELHGAVVVRSENGRFIRSLEVKVPVHGGFHGESAPATGTTATSTSEGRDQGGSEHAEAGAGIGMVTPGGPSGLMAAMGLAFLGGLILNLMPCVFPILSIKIMGFVRQAGEEPAKVRAHGYMFGFGVLVSFWILAGILISISLLAGREGWGFHLQNPWFVMVLAMLMVAVGLNLAGVFEIGYGVMNAAAKAQGRLEGSGYSGSFFTGVLATVIATPCTAPLMGPAIGWAMTVTWMETMIVFTALGAGMALPYVALSVFPAWLKALPKPGPWMETFKQVMAFPILATAVWLIWVFGNLTTGADGMMWLLASVLMLAVGLWIYGRWANPSRTPTVRWTAIATAVLLLVVSLLPINSTIAAGEAVAEADRESRAGQVAQIDPLNPPPSISEDGGRINWLPFDDDLVQKMREAGHTIFIDFTADWCLSCKANLANAINRSQVREFAAQHNVVMVKADWTRRDPATLAVLERYGRSGVPLYLT